jgi:hypothetical protein
MAKRKRATQYGWNEKTLKGLDVNRQYRTVPGGGGVVRTIDWDDEQAAKRKFQDEFTSYSRRQLADDEARQRAKRNLKGLPK